MDDKQCPIVMLSGEQVPCLGQKCGWYDNGCLVLEVGRLCLRDHCILQEMKSDFEAIQGEIREQVRALKKFAGGLQ
jgi:hypothetical protein